MQKLLRIKYVCPCERLGRGVRSRRDLTPLCLNTEQFFFYYFFIVVYTWAVEHFVETPEVFNLTAAIFTLDS